MHHDFEYLNVYDNSKSDGHPGGKVSVILFEVGKITIKYLGGNSYWKDSTNGSLLSHL